MLLFIPYFPIVSSIFLWLSWLPALFCSVTLLSFITIHLKWGSWISYSSIQHLCLRLLMHNPQQSKEQPSSRIYQHARIIENAVVENKERTDSAQYHKTSGNIWNAKLSPQEAHKKCCLCHQCWTCNKDDAHAFLGTKKNSVSRALLWPSAHSYCE